MLQTATVIDGNKSRDLCQLLFAETNCEQQFYKNKYTTIGILCILGSLKPLGVILPWCRTGSIIRSNGLYTWFSILDVIINNLQFQLSRESWIFIETEESWNIENDHINSTGNAQFLTVDYKYISGYRYVCMYIYIWSMYIYIPTRSFLMKHIRLYIYNIQFFKWWTNKCF